MSTFPLSGVLTCGLLMGKYWRGEQEPLTSWRPCIGACKPSSAGPTQTWTPSSKPVSKLSLKRLVKKAVTEVNRVNLLEIVQSKYEKLNYDDLKEETYRAKDYLKTMNLYDARIKFSIRSNQKPKGYKNYNFANIRIFLL